NPFAVRPLIIRGFNNRCRLWWGKRLARHRVGFINAVAVFGVNREFITFTCADTGDKYFPNASRAQRAHGVLRGIPPTEISHHGDTFGVRGPHGKSSAGNLAELRRVGLEVGAEYFPQALVAAF